jgi:hypothetical protein
VDEGWRRLRLLLEEGGSCWKRGEEAFLWWRSLSDVYCGVPLFWKWLYEGDSRIIHTKTVLLWKERGDQTKHRTKRGGRLEGKVLGSAALEIVASSEKGDKRIEGVRRTGK